MHPGSGPKTTANARQIFAEEPFDLGLVLPYRDQLPVVFASHRVDVVLAEELLIIRLFEGGHRAWIALELLVIHPNAANVLVGAVLRLDLPFALELHGHLRGSDRKGKQHHENKQQHPDQEVAFVAPFRLLRRRWKARLVAESHR